MFKTTSVIQLHQSSYFSCIYILRVLFFKSLLCLYGRQQILKHRDEYDKKWNDIDSFFLS